MIIEFLFERKLLPVLPFFFRCLLGLRFKYRQRETSWGRVSQAPAVIFGVASLATLLGKQREGLSLLRGCWSSPDVQGLGKGGCRV